MSGSTASRRSRPRAIRSPSVRWLSLSIGFDLRSAAQQSPAVADVCYPLGRTHGRDGAVKRREFITLLGGVAAWPLAARAQPTGSGIPRIGIIGDEDAPIWDHFRQGLRDNGYMVGQNVALEYRAAQSNVDLLRRAALELAALPVNVFVTYGSPATRAARQSTSTIPIVMIGVGDPVRAPPPLLWSDSATAARLDSK